MTDLRVEGHPGPSAAPAAAPGTGLRTSACLRYAWEGEADAPLVHALPRFWADRAIGDDDELSWLLFPAFDERASDVRDGYRPAAVAIDLEFDDGRRLLSVVSEERDRTASAPAARVDLDFPDQWNERRVPLAAFRGARVVAAHLVADPPALHGATAGLLEGWIDAPSISGRRTVQDASPAELVRTTRGSHSSPRRSRGNTQPLTGVPHGHLYIAPATDLSNSHWTYSWNAHGAGPHPFLAGLLLTRSPSIWIGDRGALAIRAGLVPDEGTGVAGEAFDHDDEEARPHRYRVTTLSGMRIDAAVGSAEAVTEIRFPRQGRLVLCAPGAPLSHVEHERASDGRLLLRLASTLPNPHEPDPLRGYYSLALSGAELVIRSGDDGRLVIDVHPDESPVRIEIGGSLISVAQAETARRRVEGRTIDEIADHARQAWDRLSSIVLAPGADEDQRALIAADLYRLFLYPTEHHEETSEGPRYASPTERLGPDGSFDTGRRIRAGRVLTDNGFWDTYRTAWPAYHLLVPERAGALLDGMLEHVRRDGWSPRWTAGTPLDAMVGTSLDVIAADAVASGVTGVDVETAYAAALRNATAASSDPRFGRKGMPQTLALGYVPATHGESVSWTIEGAINDAGAAVLARELAREAHGERAARLRAEARYLAHRATGYRMLWDQGARFFRPRAADGSWADEPFDPRVWGGAHTETNAWGSRFPAPHDGPALAELFGGAVALGDALDALFREPETAAPRFAGSYGEVIHEMPEARDIRRGMWALSNQPAHHVPWMYAYSDRPWRTSEILHDAVHRLFRGSGIGQGFPGDEDNGEMSAWHLFAQLGFAPFRPGSGQLLVTAPTFDTAVVRPLGARGLEIRVRRRDSADRHIRAVRWNGSEWTDPTVDVRALHAGGVWEVDLGPDPVPWSTPLDPRPFFAPDGVEEAGLEDAVGRVLVDGRDLPRDATVSRPLPVGSTVELEVEPGRLADVPTQALLVLGLTAAGIHSFRAEALLGGAWRAIGEWWGEAWDWERQARPFELSLPGRVRALRLRWVGGEAELSLAQILVPTEG
ncbi:putative alpha-1,2-mannosidase [Microbacterium resistens]|uniref:Alpha-1,2-mannosidase n=1 Tax=Microbacterium resistens TaxID=156977 RepID=A0ABU1SCY9_9MICO|nr:GH92 family glycosyl hydrolase [Microbacterium resistens]MDR6867456.1 putative alpha-1,2-mannosidase [Microbacterium resistens]